MKKQVKTITALFLVVMLLLSIFSVNATNIEQEQVSSNSGVQNKINSIASVYPTGSYFTSSGNVCYYNKPRRTKCNYRFAKKSILSLVFFRCIKHK